METGAGVGSSYGPGIEEEAAAAGHLRSPKRENFKHNKLPNRICTVYLKET